MAVELYIPSRRVEENEDGTRIYVRRFRAAITSNNPDTAFNDPGVPKIGEVHPSYSNAYCMSRSAERFDELTAFALVEARYSTDAYERGDRTDPRIDVDIGLETETLYVDEYGNIIGDKGQGCPLLVPIITVTATTSKRTLPLTTLAELAGKVNEAEWLGRPPQSVMYMGARSSPVRGRWELTHTFVYKPERIYRTRTSAGVVEKHQPEGSWFYVAPNYDDTSDTPAIASYQMRKRYETADFNQIIELDAQELRIE